MRLPKTLLALPLAAALAHAPEARAQDAAERAARRVTELADAFVAQAFRDSPEAATLYALPGYRHDRLSDNSLAAVAQSAAFGDSLLRELDAVDASTLWGRPEWVVQGFLRESLEASRASRVCRRELWPIHQMFGWQVGLGQLAAAQPVGSDSARAEALARWRQLPRWLDTEVANLREGLRQGYTTPKRNVQLVVEQLDALLAAPPEASPFWSPAARDSTPAFREAWRALVADDITSAIRRYRDFLRDEYLAGARESQALSALPNGRACWMAQYRGYTTVERTPEEVFELGRRTVERNQADMRRLGKELFGTDDPEALRRRVAEDGANRFSGRDEILAFSRASVERAKAAMPRWFGRLPKAEARVEPIEAYREASASSHYQDPADDGSRPGTYWIQLYRPEEQTRGVAEITAFHETYPGHHLQIALARERPSAHPITRFADNSGYVEGWGRYSESLAEEMGLYTLPHARIQRRAWPARGMVADPAFHMLGWTREQVIDYLMEAGRTREWSVNLVDRIAVLPAQLTAYDTGALEIFALRRAAEERLGDRFDVRVFHDRLLEDGSLTLRMLREKMERWMAEEAARR
ncbi:MAG TPA: DUF885 domain-containing protein [Longimicrobium sp.]|nr:DUF885 domain-containing protein [Longimicrobium sp.]